MAMCKAGISKAPGDILYENPVLYILVRKDMKSLNESVGRTGAQISHATSLFMSDLDPHATDKIVNLQAWLGGHGAGTAVVLGVKNLLHLQELVDSARSLKLRAATFTDPDYIIRDGQAFHSAQISTCGYIFGPREECSKVTCDLALL